MYILGFCTQQLSGVHQYLLSQLAYYYSTPLPEECMRRRILLFNALSSQWIDGGVLKFDIFATFL